MDPSNTQVSDKAFRIFKGEAGDNPFPAIAEVRGVAPVVPIASPWGLSERPAWLVTRMEEAIAVLKDRNHFTVDPALIEGYEPPNRALKQQADPSGPATFFTGKSMHTSDGMDHRRLRGLVSKAFTPRYMEGLRPRVQQIADELLDQVQEQGHMDLVNDYAFLLPIRVISEMLGVPKEDHIRIQEWSDALASGLGLGKTDPGVADNMRKFGEYTLQLVEQKRKHPQDDLISQLIAIEEEGDKLSVDELTSMITLLIFAGHETTSNLIATGMLMLFDYPEQLEKLKNDHSLIPNAMEELLRFNGPSTIVGPRFAKEDIELGGQQIQKGDTVIVFNKSANRDEHQFEQSEELDITRDINRHLAFGNGVHMCLGAPLARVEGDVAFTTLLQRMPNIRLGIPRDDIVWHFSLSSQSLASLPVTF
ncbi:cytochrome P450 family protein [Paenibacillus sp. WLX1005]|uniref:cytochrome P450 family protein n=1 Tax=Paenibacillus sp. WLX1005 TaxID=3243766 RepID=UPI00398447E8